MSKTILITGSTDGIGKLAALRLSKDGHTVYVHGRDPEKLELVIKEIKASGNNEDVIVFVADFSDLSAVNQMAVELNTKVDTLDVLINNAGVFKSPTQANKDGLDLRFMVNYIAPYALTKNLLPLLQKSRHPQIINLSSAAQDSVSLAALRGQEILSTQQSYAQSKLALTMWSFYLARQWPSISVIAVNPGSLLDTQMVREAYGKFWSPASKGGDILYDLAVTEEYGKRSGEYFDNDKGNPKGDFSRASSAAYDEKAVDELISVTEQILESISE